MKLTTEQLDLAVKENILTRQTADNLLAFARSHPGSVPRFDFTHILYYLGGLIAIGAMTIFMNLGWEQFRGTGLFGLALLYALFGLWLTLWFRRRQLHIPAGICATFVVCLTPLAIFGLQHATGMWPDASHYREFHRWIHWRWIYMELGTLVTAAVLLRWFRYPFLMLPVAVSLWYLSMDLALFACHDFSRRMQWDLRRMTSFWFGLVMLVIAGWMDVRRVLAKTERDYPFWLYIFAALTFWGSMTMMDSHSELSKLGYCAINCVMIGFGAMIARRVFVVLGGCGVAFYLGHLADDLFADSWLFPISLTAIGFAIVFLGLWWHNNEAKLRGRMLALLPAKLKEILAGK